MCHICQRMFPSSHLLEVHVLESHDVMFSLLSEKYNMVRDLNIVQCDRGLHCLLFQIRQAVESRSTVMLNFREQAGNLSL